MGIIRALINMVTALIICFSIIVLSIIIGEYFSTQSKEKEFMNSEFKYIEVKEKDGDEVVKRVDVSTKSYGMVLKQESKINMELNHREFYTELVESKTELEKIEE